MIRKPGCSNCARQPTLPGYGATPVGHDPRALLEPILADDRRRRERQRCPQCPRLAGRGANDCSLGISFTANVRYPPIAATRRPVPGV